MRWHPLGVVGVILAVLFIRKTLEHKGRPGIEREGCVNKPYIVAFQVHNPAIFNKSIKEIRRAEQLSEVRDFPLVAG